MELEEQDLPCGQLASNSSLPEEVLPGEAHLVVLQKKVQGLLLPLPPYTSLEY